MQRSFRKDLTHVTWGEVYARQVRRASLMSDWMEALRLKTGDRILEIGLGPGHASLVLADRVGPTGELLSTV
jgi:protein-L-isoaspartate O-methyltransferase